MKILLVSIFLEFLLIHRSYSLVTNCQNDCSGHGHCIAGTGVCSCYDSWNGGAPDCSARKIF